VVSQPIPIVPLSITSETVTLSRSDWDSILDMLDDIKDRQAIAETLAERARIGNDEYRRLCSPLKKPYA
jgi:hypothetical protein